MKRVRLFGAAGVIFACLAFVGVALAIGNGVPDGNGHPNVGMLAVEIEENGVLTRFPVCSGSYAGPRAGRPAEKVFLTAGHCVAWIPGSGISANQLWVTFDTTATFDAETGAVTGATNWHRASGFAFDSAFGHDIGNFHDYGVVLLESVPSGLAPVQMPTAGLLDRLAAKGALKPGTVFDNVGYGVVPSFKQGPPRVAPPPGRMFSTSLFKGLTQAYLKLNMNSDAKEGNGGSCYGDSGSPKFVHGTNLVVATTFGGDPICRAENINSRLDTQEARAFYGQYLALP
jgi:hypothetical protein